MDIITYQEVDDRQLTELMFPCFDHTYTREQIERMIEADRRMPDWGGEFYAREKEKILGSAGFIFPKTNVGERTVQVGGVRNVCVRPSAAEEGIATKLMKKIHERMKKEVRYSFLITDKAGKAHNLYENLGYEDIYVIPYAYKRTEGADTEVGFKDERDPEYIRSVYLRSVRGLSGLTERERDFWEMADARGWPKNSDIKIAYKDDERIGYALYPEHHRGHLLVKEIAVEKERDLPTLLKALEEQSEKDYIVLSYTNPNYKDILEKEGYRFNPDNWSVVMVKDLEEGERGPDSNFLDSTSFHIGVYESF